MNKQDYNSQLREQVYNYCNDVPVLIDGFKKGITEERFIPDHIIHKIRKVFISGSGDCWAASMLLQSIYQKYLGKECECRAFTPIELSRYVEHHPNDDTTLIIIPSVWGFPSRLVENLERAKKYNLQSIALTEKPNSPVGMAAKYVLRTHNSSIALEAKAGCDTYLGVLVSGSLLAAHLAEIKELAPKGSSSQLADTLLKYSAKILPLITSFDDQIFEIAQKWKDDVTSIMTVGDNTDFSSALLVAAKFAETHGTFGGFTNSIDWRSTQKHIQNPKSTGVIFFLQGNQPSKTSVLEAAKLAYQKGFQTLLISDTPLEELGSKENIDVILLPNSTEEGAIIESFFNHLPGDLLASYLCELWNGSYFRSAVIEESETGVDHKEGSTIWTKHGINTLQTSKHVII